jgi:hypothetical protein
LLRRLFANCLEIAREFIFSRRALTGLLPPLFTCTQFAKGQQRAKAGEKKAALAREFSISRETLYQYLNA